MAYSSLALLDAQKNFLKTIIKFRYEKENNQDVIKEYHESYDYLANVMNGFVDTAQFKIPYQELKTFLNQEIDTNEKDNNDIVGLQKKLANIKVYHLLKKMEAEIIEFVKETQSPSKSY
jgi:hypothetical protein